MSCEGKHKQRRLTRTLPGIASAAVAKVVEDNKEKGHGWQKESTEYHCAHAKEYIDELFAGPPDDAKQNITQAICRLTMALSNLENCQEGE